MGAFLVVFVTMLLAIWVAMVPLKNDVPVSDISARKPTVQAVAANMIQVHQAAVDFVQQSVNKAPTSTTWSFTVTNQASVRCNTYSGGTYPSNTASGTCAGTPTEFRSPEFMDATTPIYDWNVYYKSGTPNVVVTYASVSATPGGYTMAEINTALAAYSLKENYPNWYWGVTQSSAPYSLSNGATSLTMPTGFSSASVIAIATEIN